VNLRDPGLIRAACLLLPLAGAGILLLLRPPERRTRAAALLGTLWQLPALLLVHLLARRFDAWSYEAAGGLFLGMPVDLYLGWAILWGAIPILGFPRLPVAAVAALFLLADVVLMPQCAPVVRLGPRWLSGEGLALVIALVPAQLLSRWTLDDRRLPARATLQVICFSGLLLGVLPAAILQLTGAAWTWLLARPPWATGLLVQLVALPAVLGLSAVQEFVTRGGGTPVPYDPPRRLVTSGFYAYLANPMQASMALVLAGWGVMLGSPWVAAAAAMAVFYSAGLAAWDEGGDLATLHGDAWHAYRRSLRRWWPHWRPRHAAIATIYLAEACPACSQVRRWLERRGPSHLNFVAAEDHPSRGLRRITYDPRDGTPEEEGVAAVARALEHLHFFWAFAGCAMRLPGIRPLLQLFADVAGAGPRTIPRRSPSAGSPPPETRPRT
jgi:protein-S-isoprenylcysteine O-methyltransferase Ste14